MLGPWPPGKAPECIEIMNWLNPAERELIVQRLTTLNNIAESRIRFLPRLRSDIHDLMFDGEFVEPEASDEEAD